MKFPEKSNLNLSDKGRKDHLSNLAILTQIETNTSKMKDSPTTNFRIGVGLTTLTKTNKCTKAQNLTKAMITQVIILEKVRLSKKESGICQIQKDSKNNRHSTQWQSCVIDILSLISTVAKTSY